MHEHRSNGDQHQHIHEENTNHRSASNRWHDDVVVQSDDELLTIRDAALRAGVSRAAVLSWIRNGLIQAQTSRNGWVVRTGDIQAARHSADEYRMGLEPDGERRSSRHTQESDSQRLSDGSEIVLSRLDNPHQADGTVNDILFSAFAEFVRDQSDVLQEQAETIGWLQAELRRTHEQLDARDRSMASNGSKVSKKSMPEVALDECPDTRSMKHRDTRATDTAGDQTDAARERERAHWYNIIADDPFSDEASRARMMIEETERKIVDMWDEHEERRIRHTSSTPAHAETDSSLIKRMISPWKRRTI